MSGCGRRLWNIRQGPPSLLWMQPAVFIQAEKLGFTSFPEEQKEMQNIDWLPCECQIFRDKMRFEEWFAWQKLKEGDYSSCGLGEAGTKFKLSLKERMSFWLEQETAVVKNKNSGCQKYFWRDWRHLLNFIFFRMRSHCVFTA